MAPGLLDRLLRALLQVNRGGLRLLLPRDRVVLLLRAVIRRRELPILAACKKNTESTAGATGSWGLDRCTRRRTPPRSSTFRILGSWPASPRVQKQSREPPSAGKTARPARLHAPSLNGACAVAPLARVGALADFVASNNDNLTREIAEWRLAPARGAKCLRTTSRLRAKCARASPPRRVLRAATVLRLLACCPRLPASPSRHCDDLHVLNSSRAHGSPDRPRCPLAPALGRVRVGVVACCSLGSVLLLRGLSAPLLEDASLHGPRLRAAALAPTRPLAASTACDTVVALTLQNSKHGTTGSDEQWQTALAVDVGGCNLL